MSMNDPIADMLTRVRNANSAGHEKVDIPSSKLKESLLKVLKDEGYIKNYRQVGDAKKPTLRVYIKRVDEKTKVISQVKRVSRPGLRVYVPKERVPRVLGGLGTAVLSTSKGILTDSQARLAGVGGEHLFNIW